MRKYFGDEWEFSLGISAMCLTGLIITLIEIVSL